MSQSLHKSRKRPRVGEKTSGKCGEITFCMQVGIRVYALKCLFCPQICIQWDDFINHIEDEHDEGLRSGKLLQQEDEEVIVDVNSSKESARLQPSVSSTEVRKKNCTIATVRRNEYNDNPTASSFMDSDDPLMASQADKHCKTENVDAFEIRIVNEANVEQTCDSLDEQKPFDSINSLSESDSEMETANVQPMHSFQPDNFFPHMTNVSYFGYSEPQLPTAQEIRRIPELQTIFSVKLLENKHRTKLAKGLISFILNRQPERRILKHEFLQLSQSIVEIFPSEVKETYYVPHRTGHRAKGKLFDAYNNTRTRFSVAGLINRRFKSKPEENVGAGNGNEGENESAVEIDESDINILKSEGHDWDLVLATWRKTHGYRQRELKTQSLKIQEYIEKYNVLLHEKSYDLFDIDFKMLYPTSKTIYNWKLYYPKIVAKADKLRDTNAREILTYMNDTEDEDSKLALSFVLIAYVLPNPRQKASKVEIQESFILYCKDIAEVNEEAKPRSDRLDHDEQPKVYLIGDSNKTISEAFVELCGKRLKFKNPIKAIEVCFYCFMVMNIKYPKYIAHVWMFIQKLIYEVNTPWDSVIPAINTLINDLRLDKFQ